MKTHTIEGVGVAVSGYEEDYLDFGVDEVTCITRIAREADVEVVAWSTSNAFEDPEDPRGRSQQKIADYRAKTGNDVPPVYRMRVTIEAEKLSDDEAKAWWQKKTERGATP